jgi:Putative peptidoglycan binding domain
MDLGHYAEWPKVAGAVIKAQNATLRGLSGVRVLVEPLDPKMERAGLTKEQIQTDVEFRLRQAGVRVLPEEERQGVRGTPALFVKVDGLLSYNSQGLAAYMLSVEAYQDARLAANGASALVMTWRVSSISLVGSANLPTGIRNAVRALVDQFIDAYRRVNPQPVSSLAPSATSTRSAGSLAPPATSTRRALIHHVQERLQVGGYNPGPLDGALGRQTREALRGFQKAKGLRPTGELDAATLTVLGVQ